LNLSARCGALDYNLGCSGYIYGLAMAHSLIKGGVAGNVLLLTAETYSRHIHPDDRNARTIFGDAGAATLISGDSRSRLHSFVLRTDGSGAEQLMVKTGGARCPRTRQSATAILDESGNVRDPNCLYMHSSEVFNFALQSVPELVHEVVGKASLQLRAIDSFVFHQANAYILEHLRRKLCIPRDRFEICLEECGNTVSSTIPIALQAAIQAGRIKPGMKVLLAGFGAGLSWGGCLLDWEG
jgi:3-oxoacyl-[acyl-carrier-protein] synthase-3